MPTPEKSTSTVAETRFAAWKRVHRIRLKTIATVAERSIGQVARYLLPADHPDHNHPPLDVSDRIRRWTGDAFHAGNYADPYVPGEPLPPAPKPAAVQRADAVPHDTQ